MLYAGSIFHPMAADWIELMLYACCLVHPIAYDELKIVPAVSDLGISVVQVAWSGNMCESYVCKFLSVV
jgi:hypothetical protein